MNEVADDEVLDITPDTKVLLALTHTPLKPLDALCELIDNGIDAFRAAEIAGHRVRHPLLEISVPGTTHVKRGEGIIRVIDNGAGLDRRGLANTLRAGFSGKNRFDTLGLFGMGFNIATGKMGQITTVTTARREDNFALKVVIDLPTLVKNRKFEVPVQEIDKPRGFDHGTIVEVSSWWPEGHPNAGFVAQLASIPKGTLSSQIGRRYASLLREGGGARVTLNQDLVEGFEHCVWSQERSVERQGWGLIPARLDIDSVVASQRRCLTDGSLLEGQSTECLECGGSEFRTVEERIRGWVGIQRFDDNNKFGIDLVRNGRVIRVGEKDAFFNHVDELGEAIKEYPTDQQTGRIVGEIHLDHIPVDFQKQDFQRSSEEWQRAVRFLRGGSLLPSNWPAGIRNESPVSKLFQGYRKVRNYGRADMYMGRYDEAARKAVRVSREIEADFYRKFLARESGYVDDARWWDLVESASVPPLLAMEECVECGFQNSPDDEVCGDCGRILRSKPCISCDAILPRSATLCPECGNSQIPEVNEPWKCEVCSQQNDVSSDKCGKCDSLRGTENPVAIEVLRRKGDLIPELSFVGRSFVLADLRRTEPLDVSVYRAGSLKPVFDGPAIPSITVRSMGKIEVFLDSSHLIFSQLGVNVEEIIAVEVAQYLYNVRTDLSGKPAHSVGNIASQVLMDIWGEQLSHGAARVTDEIQTLFERITDRLESNSDAVDYYDDLDQFDQRELADRLISAGKLDELTNLKMSGRYLRFCSPGVISKFFRRKPDAWFGSVWLDRLPEASDVGETAAQNARDQLVGNFSRCLEDCAAYLRFRYSDPLIVSRAGISREFLENHLL
ncbi:ATP-binding protein [Paenarthrobacter sp. NPDC090522]|uniref:ATP-binding protein n=1 Tax=Paenarthrobacter sp. NPDC090522 TaxID=3364383 RepID=UPI0038198AB3